MRKEVSAGILAGLCVLLAFLTLTPPAKREPAAAPSTSPAPPRPPEPAACLVRSEPAGQVNSITVTVTGTVKNTCGRSFDYVAIQFKIFDETGAVVGTAIANQVNLGDGETWRYNAVSIAAGKRFRFDSITAR